MGACPATVHVETETVPLALLERFRKYFHFRETRSLDAQATVVRAKKSAYELSLMERAGKIHRHVLEDVVPAMLREGMSEAELGEVRKDGRCAYYRVARGEARKTVRPVLKWLEDMLGGNGTVIRDAQKLADIVEKSRGPRRSVSKEC